MHTCTNTLKHNASNHYDGGNIKDIYKTVKILCITLIVLSSEALTTRQLSACRHLLITTYNT